VINSTAEIRCGFGASKIDLGKVGFGAASLGNLYCAISEHTALTTVQTAIASGVRYFDTAPYYGFGLSELRLGTALRASAAQDQSLVISTKVGRLLVPTNFSERERHGFVDAPPLEPKFDYSYAGIMRSFEESLRRLQLPRIDILLAHDLGSLTHGTEHPRHFRDFLEGGYRAMNDLKTAGLVSAIGMGTNEWQICEAALAHCDFDGFLLAGRYTLLEQTACDSFLPLCSQRGVSIIAAGPFNSGILAPKVSGEGQRFYNYAPAPAPILARVARLEAVCAEFAVPLAAAALQFPAAHPQVTTVLAGFASPAQVVKSQQLMATPIPHEFWLRLQALELLHPEAPIPVNDTNLGGFKNYDLNC
jgi:D-threo-aldose 1-dehydrogenase